MKKIYFFLILGVTLVPPLSSTEEHSFNKRPRSSNDSEESGADKTPFHDKRKAPKKTETVDSATARTIRQFMAKAILSRSRRVGASN